MAIGDRAESPTAPLRYWLRQLRRHAQNRKKPQIKSIWTIVKVVYSLLKSRIFERNSIYGMPKRTSIKDVTDLEDLNDLNEIVHDKRVNKRDNSKKERRNRHYVKVLIKSQLRNPETDNSYGERLP